MSKTWSEGDKTRFLAISTLCRNHPKILEFLFKPDRPEMQSDAEEMMSLAGCLSGGEQVLVGVALDIWFYQSERYGHIMDVCRRLDDGNFKAVIDAMLIARRM